MLIDIVQVTVTWSPLNSTITPTDSDVIAENRVKLQIVYDIPEAAHAVVRDTRCDREIDIFLTPSD